MPTYIVVDMSWLEAYEDDKFWLYKRIPIRVIIEIITSTPIYIPHYMEVFWDHFTRLFDDNEVSDVMVKAVQLVVENLITEFYKNLEQLVGDIENDYLFHGWFNHNSLVMIKNSQSHMNPPSTLRRFIGHEHYDQFKT